MCANEKVFKNKISYAATNSHENLYVFALNRKSSLIGKVLSNRKYFLAIDLIIVTHLSIVFYFMQDFLVANKMCLVGTLRKYAVIASNLENYLYSIKTHALCHSRIIIGPSY